MLGLQSWRPRQDQVHGPAPANLDMQWPMLSLKMPQKVSVSDKRKEALMHIILAISISSFSACEVYATKTTWRII